ncbi:p-aminobenzoyl-glutamate hydrolase subunit B [Caulifigura coniformis]|uniref:p-aminobenzoyl-glutamate hydrolase subunit B n=1 Tax=Caulifigura coniformis TaxID=2527983 RepID=A0A517SGW2_9PLAN|nr:amidohydrolase [Caulifigura coniformis]QDT55369.1 p-aminobenzoyl-glutamate hydrolase subunit B [Caulifigura coniformis]
MPRLIVYATLAIAFLSADVPAFAQSKPLKEAAVKAVTARTDEAWTKAAQIWEWAEPGYQEFKSSKLLADWLESAGFRVTREVAGMPTAFIAEFGEGKPVIALLGEYDALPGLAQEGVPHREPRPGNGYGHGCGHHLFGVASAAACLSIAEQIKAGALKGTVRFYGCPAEEGGGAKAFMARDGLFKDVDVALHWHPGTANSAGDRGTLARIAAKFRFHGKSAHAGGSPEQGRSALDGVELMAHAVEMLREHTPEETRIHHVITSGGQAPNVVPDYAEVYFYVRHPKSLTVRQIFERVEKCAEGAALATETRLEIKHEGGIAEILPNVPMSQVILKNLKDLNKLEYSAKDLEFAARLSETLEKPEPVDRIRIVSDRSGDTGRGSTDVGDVSWVVPTSGFGTACFVPGTPAHSWQAVACGQQPFARDAMMLAAQVLAATTFDLMTRPELVAAARADFARRTDKQKYTPLIAPDQKPPLDYRTPVKSGAAAVE